MKHFVRCALIGATLFGTALFSTAARAQGGMPDLSDFGGAIEKKSQVLAKQKPVEGAIFKTSLSVASVKPGTNASALIRAMRLKMEEQAKTNPEYANPQFLGAFKDLENQMPAILTGLEAEMSKQGFQKRDMGVAAGLVFTTLYETALDKKLSDKANDVAAKAMATVADQAWKPKFSKLAPAEQEKLYENLLTSAIFQSLMAQQFADAKKTEDEKSIRDSAASLFETLVGLAPAQVKISDDGQISGLQNDEETAE